MDPTNALRGGAVVLTATLCVPSTARAGVEESPHYEVALEVAPDAPLCDRPETFRHLVGGMLFDPLLAPPASHTLRASIRRSPGGGYATRIVTRDAGGSVVVDERTDYPDIACFEVLWHVALAAATIIEPHPRRPELQTSLRSAPCARLACPACPEPPPCPRLAPAPQPPAPKEAPAAKMEAPSPPSFFLGGSVLYATGITPDPAPGLQLFAGLSGSRWSFEVDGRVTLPMTTAPLGETVVQTWALSASAVPCLWLDPRLGICAVATVGRLGAAVAEVPGKEPYPFTDGSLFVTVGGRVAATLPITGSLALRLDADVVGPIVRAPIRTPLASSLWATSPTAGTIALSIVKKF